MVTSDYITIAFWFECNNNCRSCLLRGEKKNLKPIGVLRYRQLVRSNSNKYSGIILSGAEVTTSPYLIPYCLYAKRYFSKIRIQTNGRRLADKKYLNELIDNGVNEFYVSLCGASSKQHDHNTRVAGSFDATIAGIMNIAAKPCPLMVNVVVTKYTYKSLSDIVRLCNVLGVGQIELWNYLPMRKTDRHSMMVSPAVSAPYIKDAVDLSLSLGLGPDITLKYFPSCNLSGYEEYINNTQPKTIIGESHWIKWRENSFSCPLECDEWSCCGLPAAYINKYGSECIGDYDAKRKKDD